VRPARFEAQLFCFLLSAIVVGLGAAYTISCSHAEQSLSLNDFTSGLLYRTSNCGGNSSALSFCKQIALGVLLDNTNNPAVFDVNLLSQETKGELRAFVGNHWIPNARFLLRRNALDITAVPHKIIVVCDQPFGNVPQPTFWNLHRSTIRHAAVLADGTIRLLTPDEFGALKLPDFVFLSDVVRGGPSQDPKP
jgi:hypothetical protein